MAIVAFKEKAIWVSEKRYMVLNTITGKPIRFGEHWKAIGSLEEAMERCSGHEWDNVIVELTCVTPKNIKE
jgi:hypothetical protein